MGSCSVPLAMHCLFLQPPVCVQAHVQSYCAFLGAWQHHQAVDHPACPCFFHLLLCHSGVAVQYHEEPNEPHSYCVLALPHLLKKSQVVLEYIAHVAQAEQQADLISGLVMSG